MWTRQGRSATVPLVPMRKLAHSASLPLDYVRDDRLWRPRTAQRYRDGAERDSATRFLRVAVSVAS